MTLRTGSQLCKLQATPQRLLRRPSRVNLQQGSEHGVPLHVITDPRELPACRGLHRPRICTDMNRGVRTLLMSVCSKDKGSMIRFSELSFFFFYSEGNVHDKPPHQCARLARPRRSDERKYFLNHSCDLIKVGLQAFNLNILLNKIHMRK